MGYLPGQAFHRSFLTPQGFGQLLNPSGGVTTPVIAMRRNGAVDGAVTVTVTHNGLGDWTASGMIPSTYAAGDDVELVITFTFSDIASGELINLGPLDSANGPVAGYAALNHNTGGANALAVYSAGNPVSGATIRVFLKSAYVANPQTAQCLGATTSDSAGHWLQPIFVPPGATYAVVVSAIGDQTQEVDVTV